MTFLHALFLTCASNARLDAIDAADYRDDHPPDTLGHIRGQFWYEVDSMRAEAWTWLAGKVAPRG